MGAGRLRSITAYEQTKLDALVGGVPFVIMSTEDGDP